MQGRATGPANNATTPAIENGGEVQPAFGGLEVGNVGEPTLIGPGRCRPGGQEVGRDWLSMPAIRGARPTPVFLFPAQALSPHQTGAAAFARARAHHPQVLDNARRPIAASAGLVGLPDLPGEGRVFALPGARPLPASVIIAAGRDAQQLA